MDQATIAAIWTNVDSNITQLWAMFVAGNFAAVAFVVSQGALSSFQKWTVSVGYSVYAIGIATLRHDKCDRGEIARHEHRPKLGYVG
ncbi:MAG: hypothetical protein AAGP08_14405, partial [Pseudomonadota bacterium]